MSKRAAATLKFLREEYSWLATGRSAVVFSADRARWWTFAGVLANVTLTTVLRKIGLKAGKADNFSIQIDDRSLSPNWEPIADKLRAISFGEVSTTIDSKALDRLKFSTCLPRDLGFKELRARLSDAESYTRLVRQPVSVIKEPDSQ